MEGPHPTRLVLPRQLDQVGESPEALGVARVAPTRLTRSRAASRPVGCVGPATSHRQIHRVPSPADPPPEGGPAPCSIGGEPLCELGVQNAHAVDQWQVGQQVSGWKGEEPLQPFPTLVPEALIRRQRGET